MLRALIPLLLVIAWSHCLAAEAPDWRQQLKPSRPGTHPALPAGKLEYRLSWKGILNSGMLEFDIGKAGAHKPGMIVIQSTGKSMGLGGTIFPYNGNGWSEIHAGSLRPSLMTATEKKRGEEIETTNRFSSDKVSFRELTKDKKRRKKVKEHVFAQGPAYDIGSAILFIRSQRLHPGDKISIMMHPYSSPYLLQANVIGKEKRDEVDCIRLSMTLHKIDLKTLKLKPYKKMKEPAQIWFSDDKLRLPLEVRSKVFIGDIRATLQGFQQA